MSRKDQPVNESSMRKGASLSALGTLLALMSGCMQEPNCPALGECGGDFRGTWQLAPGFPSCIEDLYNVPKDPRLYGGEVPAARTPVIEPALFDWCYLLVTDGGQNIRRKSPQFFYESGPIGWASLTYTPDPTIPNGGQYVMGISRTGTYYLDFPPYCMRAFGAMDNRPVWDPTVNMYVGEPVNICKQLEFQLSIDGVGEGAYPTVQCEQNPEELAGCLCAFNVSETGGPSGTYQLLADGRTIMHMPGTNLNFPQEAKYCASSGSLELTGDNGSYLFGQKGLRTMKLAKAVVDPCANGVQDGTETGVDCGGTCPMACAAPP
jgi:hypothetical protein